MGVRLVEAELFNADGQIQTDGRTGVQKDLET